MKRIVKRINNYWLLALSLILYLFLLSNLEFIAWPEMLLWPYLMLKGWLPYKDIAIAHNPLLIYLLSCFYKIFGIGLIQLKTFTYLVIAFSLGVTYKVAKRLFDSKIATISTLCLMPLMIYYQANGLWFDLVFAVLLPAIYYFVRKNNFLWAGSIWALAFLNKQTAVFFLIPLFFEMTNLFNLLKTQKSKGKFKLAIFSRKIRKFLLGVVAVIVPFTLIIWFLGYFGDYVFWTLRFAGGKLPFSSGQISLPAFKELVVSVIPFSAILPAILIDNKNVNLSLVIWIFAAVLGSYPRWELFHFLPALPLLSILYGKLLSNKMITNNKLYLKYFIIGILVITFGKSIFRDWQNQTRFFENDVYKVTDYLNEKLDNNEKMFVLNSWEHYYVLTDTLPAIKPWAPQFSWYLNTPFLEDKMLSDLIIESPRFVIYHPYSQVGLDSYKPEKISNYIFKYYELDKSFGNFQVLRKR